ncbi:hypothetical protein [Rariglobus hedericola]|uniref:Uncharacterized protein n=1 Tax=Rariglobus hedericola TaxID=2597822 RepID=A0A556QS53_9BACT|nr:hypothetical protein [Rariglobus hedericola]TSJ79475.1 hypothetical protein FPL22_09360 [Rariglobus hedericola]
MDIPLLMYLAPFCLLFEGWQLVIAERHIGLKQIEQGVDPRSRGPGELLSFAWGMGIVCYWVWMILMLIPKDGRAQVVCMLIVSLLGYSLRRNSGLKWILVILTVEGAIRIGMIVSLISGIWRSL